MKITPIDVIASVSGKISKNSDTFVVLNPQTGKMHTQHVSKEKIEKSDKQLAVMSKFLKRQKLMSKWFAENKPSTENPKGTELYQTLYAEYKSQNKIGSMQHFVKSLMTDEGEIVLEEKQ